MGRVSNEVADEIAEEKKNSCFCQACKSDFIFLPGETFWDEHGYGYSTKLAKCPHCGRINVIKTVEDYGFKKLNTDRRYF